MLQAVSPSSRVQLHGADGMPPHVGAVRVIAGQLHEGGGSVCGMNLAAADVVCRQLGYEYGSVGTSPCSNYGGRRVCEADGLPVAMRNLQCTGNELDVVECDWEEPAAECADHGLDSVVYCSGAQRSVGDGAVRLISQDGSPSINGEGRLEVYMAGAWASVCRSGFTDGARAVACKALGYAGSAAVASGAASALCARAPDVSFCGSAAPRISNLACSGHEPGLLSCPFSEGDDVYCAAEARAAGAASGCACVMRCLRTGECRLAVRLKPAPLQGQDHRAVVWVSHDLADCVCMEWCASCCARVRMGLRAWAVCMVVRRAALAASTLLCLWFVGLQL